MAKIVVHGTGRNSGDPGERIEAGSGEGQKERVVGNWRRTCGRRLLRKLAGDLLETLNISKRR